MGIIKKGITVAEGQHKGLTLLLGESGLWAISSCCLVITNHINEEV